MGRHTKRQLYPITCCLMLTFYQHVASAQQPKSNKAPTEDFVKLGMPIEEALTQTTFVVEWLSGDGRTEVIFQGENVIRAPDYIKLRRPYKNDSSRYSSYWKWFIRYGGQCLGVVS